jgi:hypothetical protein
MGGQLNMDDRYGRKKSPLRLIPYVIFALLIGWLFWSATHHSNPTVAVNLISFKEINEKSMGITFDITRNDPSQAIDCKLTAVDFDKYVVGEIVHRIPAGDKSLRVTTQIPTRVHSVSADVVRCYPAN